MKFSDGHRILPSAEVARRSVKPYGVHHTPVCCGRRGVPLKVFHFDCFWMKGLHWCDFEWDTETFPDPDGQLAPMKQDGTNICVWINPYIAQLSPLFAEGRKKGYDSSKCD